MRESFDLEEATIAGLTDAFQAGRVSGREVLAEYRRRVEAIDHGHALGAVLELNAQLDEPSETREGDGNPLNGLPILIKDNVETLDGLETTAGSLALLGCQPKAEAPVIARLKAAGAVIFGKTNMSEWANFRSVHSLDGWSARGGQCRNPYVLDRSPCGSSSGSAAAVAANLAVAAIGTETDGSIVCPSGMCGVVGLKPTVGLVPTDGVIPIAPSQDVVGVHARTVSDAALVLEAIVESGDAYSVGLDSFRLAGTRIGVLREPFAGYSPPADAVLESALAALRGEGAVLIDPVALGSADELSHSDAEMTLLVCEFKDALNRYLRTRGDESVGSLEQLIAFNAAHSSRELELFGQDLLMAAAESGGVADPRYSVAKADCQRLGKQAVDAALRVHQLNAIVALTRGPAWLIDHITATSSPGGSSQPAALAGYPLLTVPAGFVAGELPIGITFMGPAFSERLLIQIAFAFERVTKERRPPRLLPTLGR